MAQVIEIKLHKPNITWERTPIYTTAIVTNDTQAHDIAQKLADDYQKETRWNYEHTQHGYIHAHDSSS